MLLNELNQRFVVSADHVEEWMAIRAVSITATDAAKLAKNSSVASVFNRKRNPQPFVGNESTDWGTKREPLILKALGLPQNRNAYHALGEKKFLATPDSVGIHQGELSLCEVKTTVNDFTGKIPLGYYRQMQWQMYVTDAKKCLFAWELRGHDFSWVAPVKTQWVSRNEMMIEELKGLAREVLNLMF